MSRYICAISFSAIAVTGCKKPYTPAIVAADNHYLVVEGVINSGQDSTIIQLSRTVNIAGKSTVNPEMGAQVAVAGDQNVSYPLKETKPGRYVSAPLNLDSGHKYQLKITTVDNKAYQSDFAEVKVTPPIDTLYYTTDNTGLSVFTAAHDPSNSTRYYRWDYTETYIYESGLTSYYKFENNHYYETEKSIFRKPAELINTCYDTDTSTTVILNSSAKLAQDVINVNAITQVSASSEKVLHRYSILVKQYALTRGAFDFWTLLKTNTEKLGGIFDAQPTQLNGNIHCITTPSEPVIGYISVCTVSQKRIFIDRTDLPVWPYVVSGCQPFSEGWYKKSTTPVELVNGIEIPLSPITSFYDQKVKDTAYTVKVGYYDCVDCRYHNYGTTMRPGFWK
ncbi:MAG: DUF4249 domain-containing protein [Mucilaginibacter sp.]